MAEVIYLVVQAIRDSLTRGPLLGMAGMMACITANVGVVAAGAVAADFGY